MLDADELVLEALGLGVGGLEHAHDARRRVDLHDVVAELRRACPGASATRSRSWSTGTFRRSRMRRAKPLVVREHGEEDVLDVPLRVPVLAHQLLGGLQHLLRLLCESVLSHHDVLPTYLFRFRWRSLASSGGASPSQESNRMLRHCHLGRVSRGVSGRRSPSLVSVAGLQDRRYPRYQRHRLISAQRSLRVRLSLQRRRRSSCRSANRQRQELASRRRSKLPSDLRPSMQPATLLAERGAAARGCVCSSRSRTTSRG